MNHGHGAARHATSILSLATARPGGTDRRLAGRDPVIRARATTVTRRPAAVAKCQRAMENSADHYRASVELLTWLDVS